MRKSLVLSLFLVLALSAWGQKISVGAGLSYGSVWMATGVELGGISESTTMSAPPFGIHAFVDAEYIQAGLGYLMNSGQTQVDKYTGFSDVTTKYTDKLSWLDIDVIGKYPIELGSVTIFPFAGLEYLLNLTYTDKDGNDLKPLMTYKDMFDALMIKAGLGADFSVNPQIYVRPEAFVGYKIIKSDFDKYAGTGMDYFNWWEVRGMVLVGYRL